jgi:hypothetical protein
MYEITTSDKLMISVSQLCMMVTLFYHICNMMLYIKRNEITITFVHKNISFALSIQYIHSCHIADVIV